MIFSSSICFFRNLQTYHFLKHTQTQVRFKHVILDTIEHKLGLPDKPKKPIMPFFQYMIAVRSSVVAQNPELSTNAHVKLISQMWNSLDGPEKQKYYKTFFSERVVYNELLAKYEETITEDEKQLLKAKRKEVKQEIDNRKNIRSQRKKALVLDRPKRPISVYFKYLAARPDRQPNEAYPDYLRRKSSEWKSLSKSEQEAFNTSAECAQKYKSDLLEWKGKMIKLGEYDVLRSEIKNYAKFDKVLKPGKID